MTTLSRSRIRHSVATALCLVGVAGLGHTGTATAAANRAEPVMQSSHRASDSELPALARHGTGMVGAFNAGAMNAPQLSIALPDGRVITAFRQRTVDSKSRGVKSWLGTFLDQPGSLVSLTTYKGVTTGTVSYGTESWELMPTKGGSKHVLYRVDESQLPTAQLDAQEPSTDADVAAGGAQTSAATTDADAGGYVHDLLIVYTPASKLAHGQATLESMLQNAVAMANQAYQNSNVRITLNIVGLQEINYVESGDMQISLNHLRDTADGNIDSIHKLRDTLGADIVSMITEDKSTCGMADVMTNVSTASAYKGFNIVKGNCLGQHSLAHEVGHNQGNRHDRASTDKVGAYPYSHGFRRCASDGTGFRTVMAYACTGSPRVAWFSNPNANYNGYATGIDYESDPANSADNARSMNNTASVVAAFRGGTTTTPPPPPPPEEPAPPVAPTAPTAPSGLSASATAYNSVTVRWTDNSSNESGFKLERSGNGVDYTEIATLGAAATSFVDNGVVASHAFYYRVRAYNSVGNSSFSNTGTVTTPAVPAPPPAAPASVSARNDGDGSATVTWVDASTNESTFEVRREKWDSKRSRWIEAMTVGTVPSGLTSLDDNSGNGTYRYLVRALNSSGASALVGPASVTVTGGTTSSTGKKGGGGGRNNR